jgi:hypothetical protein
MFGLTGIAAKLCEYLIVILVVAGVMFGVYHKGGVDMKDSIELAQKEADKLQQDKYDKISSDYEELKNKRQQNANTIVREITKVIEQPIYSTVCVDDTGRMLINDALSGRAVTRKSDAAVQAAPKP